MFMGKCIEIESQEDLNKAISENEKVILDFWAPSIY